MTTKATFKTNEQGSILICSRCSKEIKKQPQFTNDELLASKGLKLLPPQYCIGCKKFINKSNDCGCK